ncbi:kinetochore Sim4 complex subunit FTA2-domain-containing protein [Exophiala viscosa]|uniref:Kinetochore Sim4 complex subunit FTA2-domain-containing protein n=1 Tax=Exophiala viscosa TaxID=2486360 RepID=A0AAN6E465_9EURO|nr:kinetochore Sim4 complex subunit FTA2-domain-containing protein [Exophiala viscosa]KAI1629417.1 kinetochore Sim4 complex subunit FTA2-domain-containing protein [Exophiala viscosa]
MGAQLRDAELMGENIIGIYLSEEPMCDSTQPVEDDEPRLRRFIYDGENIQQPQLIGSGIHGVVVLIAIKGAEYVLKIFRHWKQPGPVFYDYDSALLISPLACESRAFARLHSLNENGTWAARCYGWMTLSDTQFGCLKMLLTLMI